MLLTHVRENNLISDMQFGFREDERQRVTQLFRVLDSITHIIII